MQEPTKVQHLTLNTPKLKLQLLKVLKPRVQCYKNTTVNYCGNFNPTFSRVKMTLKNDLGLKNIAAILG